MARRHAISVQILGRGQQVFELYPLVAANAGHGGCPRKVSIGEIFDHGLAKGVFIIQHIMRKAHLFGHAAGIVNIAARTAGPLFGQSSAMIVKLQGHAHDVIALVLEHRGHD